MLKLFISLSHPMKIVMVMADNRETVQLYSHETWGTKNFRSIPD